MTTFELIKHSFYNFFWTIFEHYLKTARRLDHLQYRLFNRFLNVILCDQLINFYAFWICFFELLVMKIILVKVFLLTTHSIELLQNLLIFSPEVSVPEHALQYCVNDLPTNRYDDSTYILKVQECISKFKK